MMRGLLAGIAGVVLVAGCSTQATPTSSPALPQLQPPALIAVSASATPPYPELASPSARPPEERDPAPTGPLARYLLTPTGSAELHYALDAMTSDCMQAFGREWSHESYSAYRRGFQNEMMVSLSWDYGVTEPSYGYRRPEATIPRTEGQMDFFLLQGRKDPAAGGPVALETISPGEVDGRLVPPGGCQGQAWRSLGDEGGIGWGSSAVSYWTEAIEVTKAQPGYEAALAPWISCMAEKRYTVTDPIDDEGDIAKARERGTDMGQPYPEEIRLAEADAACKQDTGLIEALTPLRLAAQQQVLDENFEALEADRAMLDHKISLARAWITEHGDGPSG